MILSHHFLLLFSCFYYLSGCRRTISCKRVCIDSTKRVQNGEMSYVYTQTLGDIKSAMYRGALKSTNQYMNFCRRIRATRTWQTTYARLPVPRQGRQLGVFWRSENTSGNWSGAVGMQGGANSWISNPAPKRRDLS